VLGGQNCGGSTQGMFGRPNGGGVVVAGVGFGAVVVVGVGVVVLAGGCCTRLRGTQV
jgi:hypothetical protein